MTSRYRFNPLSELIRLIYPSTCCSCGKALVGDERHLCTHCLLHLPLAHFSSVADNLVERHFIGRIPLQSATTLLVFRPENIAQHIIHDIKYYGNRKLAIQMGRILGAEINASGRFSDVDGIIPVPLHRRRMRQRGYNQSELISIGISETFGRPVVSDQMIRTRHTQTQTHKNRSSRIENMEDVFQVKSPEKLKGRHLLLVDDVITSGATIESCWRALSTIPDIKVSIASLSMAGIG